MKRLFVGAVLLLFALAVDAQVQPRPGGSSQITGVSGNGHSLATTSGPLTAGDGIVPDANGNLIDSGSPAAASNNPSFTVGTGGVTANHIVTFDSNGNAINSTGTGFGGLAAATVAAAGTVQVIRQGIGTCVFDGAAAVGDIAVPSSGTPSECHDSGQTSSQGIASNVNVIGPVETAASGAGQTGTVRLDCPGCFGAGFIFLTNPQTATYQALASDFINCRTITVASGTFTITLVASGSQPANGQCLNVINYGTGVVTIARSGQNINGGTSSLTVAAASATAPTGAHVVSDGTNYVAAIWGASSGGGGLFAGILGTLPTLSGTGLTTAFNHSGTYTVSNVATGILLSDPTGPGGTQIQGQLVTYPSVAYTLTALYSMPTGNGTVASANTGFGISISQSATTGKSIWYGPYYSGGWSLLTYTFSAPGTLGSSLATSAIPASEPYIWLRLKDDGTNLTFSYSYDGIAFMQTYTVAKSASYMNGNFNFLGAVLVSGIYENTVLQSWTITTP